MSTIRRRPGGPNDPSNQVEKPLIRFMYGLRGTVVSRIWWQELILIVYTTIVLCIHNLVEGFHMSFPMTLIPVLGVVTGLLLVFRTNTAYDRYWNGRKIWSSMHHHLRCLTMSIWTGVNDSKKRDNGQDLVEKISAINLIIAFAFATKNYLRGEYSYDDPDLLLVNYLPRFQPPQQSDTDSQNNDVLKNEEQEVMTNGGSTESIMESSMDTPTITIGSGSTAILFPNDNDNSRSPGPKESEVKKEKRKKKEKEELDPTAYENTKGRSWRAHDFVTPSKIPMEIIYYLFAYHKRLAADFRCEITTIKSMNSSIIALVDCLTQFERIVRTPIPFAYNVHLHCVVWLYLLALPFQLVGNLNWWTLAAVPLASFALLGILAIGFEIENPFGYDDNDLPLDDYCNVIKQELQTVMACPIPTLEKWMINDRNYPLGPHIPLNAQQLSEKSREAVDRIVAQGMDKLLRKAEIQ